MQKPFYQSRTLWGGVLIVGAWALATFTGVAIPEAAQATLLDTVMEAIDKVALLAGSGLVIWGRLKAAKSLTLT